jgi:Flp pilus assembly protein TadD
MNRGSEAVSQLNRAAQLAKNSFPQIYVALASALMSIRDYANARAQLLQFLKMAPSNPDAGKIKTLVARIEAQMGSTQSQSVK